MTPPPDRQPNHRSRWIILPALVCVASAFTIRFASDWVLMVLRTYGDDFLIALAAYLLVGAAFRRTASWKVLAISLGIMWAIQVAELFHPAWMGPYWARLRFEWSDMASFAVGAGIGFGADVLWRAAAARERR